MYILKDFCNSVLKIYQRFFARTEFVTPDILPFDRISVDQCIWKQGENSTKNAGKIDQNKMAKNGSSVWLTLATVVHQFKNFITFLRDLLNRPARIAELPRSKFDPELFPHSAYVDIFVTFATKVPYLTFCNKM